MCCIFPPHFESAFKKSLMRIKESANCWSLPSAVPAQPRKRHQMLRSPLMMMDTQPSLHVGWWCVRQEGVKTEMLVLLLADRVVRVTGLLIWQVTWEPRERLQRRSALFNNHIPYYSKSYRQMSAFCLKPALINRAWTLIAISLVGRFCIVWLYLKL